MVRARSLFLGGGPRIGKTCWIRSLGPHSYFGGVFNLRDYNDGGLFHVFDDFGEWKYVPNKRGWFGCQHNFSVTGKYMPVTTIANRGRPSVYLYNADSDPFLQMSSLERVYYEETCVRLWLTDKLF